MLHMTKCSDMDDHGLQFEQDLPCGNNNQHLGNFTLYVKRYKIIVVVRRQTGPSLSVDVAAGHFVYNLLQSCLASLLLELRSGDPWVLAQNSVLPLSATCGAAQKQPA